MNIPMKNSNVPWIGEIPEEWEVIQFRRLFVIRKIIAGKLGYDVLSVTQSGIKIKDITKNEGQLAQDYSKYQLVHPNDFVMNHMDLLTGYIDCSKYNGVTSPDYRVFRDKMTYKISLSYYLYIFQLAYITKIFYQLGQGVSDRGRWRLPAGQLLLFDLPLPRYDEQKKIADYLDKVCGEIDDMIALQEKMIEELKAYKQSVITEAVTKGLNPNVPMRDSGIDWIGEIPEHWVILRLKFMCDIQTGNQDTQDAIQDGEYPFYVRSPKVEHSIKYSFEGEGILMAGDGAGAGRVFHHAFGKYAVHQRVYRLSSFKDINTYYLFHYISNLFCKVMDMGSAQSTVPSVRLPMLLNFIVCMPPLSEQQAIADFLDKKCADIDALIAIKQKKIEELKDYKKSLIYEYVTGKKEIN